MTASHNRTRSCLACGFEATDEIAVCPNDGIPLTESGDLLLGTTLDKYEINEIVGVGGMGTVYKARHILMDRIVALKVLRRELVHDKAMMARFQLEAKAVSRLKHPNVLAVHDFGVTPDQVPYLVMDLLDGITIADILETEGPLAPGRAINIFIQVCEALGHAHSKGVIHRDIKPGNIVISKDNSGADFALVVDFGIAKVFEEGKDVNKLTATGHIFGSPSFMSPEQCMGGNIDQRTDVYSLGCVIYEAVTGVSALCGDSLLETLFKHVNETPRPFSEANRSVAQVPELEAIVFTALSKKASDRFQSMAEMADALRQAGSGIAGFNHAAAASSEYSRQGPTGTVRVTGANQGMAGISPAASSTTGKMVPPQAEPLNSGGTPSPHLVQSSDRNTRAQEVFASYDLFGNQQIMPAAPDASPRQKVDGSGGQIFGSADPTIPSRLVDSSDIDSSALRVRDGASRNDYIKPDGGNAKWSSSASLSSSSSNSSSVRAGLPDTRRMMMIGGISFLCLLGVGAFLARDKLFGQAGGNSLPQFSSNMSPNELFKACSPSIVKLTVVTKATQVKMEDIALTDVNGDPILVAPDADGNQSLYKDGKPADIAVGLAGSKKKTPVAVKLVRGEPIIVVLNENLKPLTRKDGSAVIISKGVSLEPYKSTSIGSGFFVEPDVVATNCHVVSAGSLGAAAFTGGVAEVTNRPGGLSITDKPLVVDKDRDLALLYIPGSNAPTMRLLDDYGKLKVGDEVYALGSPRGLSGSLSEGRISSDKLRGSNPKDPDSQKLYLQHSAKIDHGNSGGPLIDSKGEVVGVNTAYMGNGAINLAVVSKFVKELLDKPEVRAKIKELNEKSQTDLHG